MSSQKFSPRITEIANRRLAWSAWSLRLPTGIAARWTLGVAVVVIVALWGALRQPPRADPLEPEGLLSLFFYPKQTNAFVEPVIRSDLTAVFPMPDGRTIWAGGSGGLLIVSRDAGASWDTAAVYGPANWDSLVAARLQEASAVDTTTNSLFSDTIHGQSTYPSDSMAADTFATTALRTADPARASANPVRVLLRAVGALAGPTPLYAQIRGAAPEQASPITRKIRLAGELNDIFFLDDQHGWAITTAGDVLATRDGGARWELYPSATPSVTGIGTLGFADSLRGVVTTGAGVMRTINGGRTWTAVLPDTTTGELKGRLVSGEVGYAVDEADANLMRTDDAGATWRSVPTPQGNGSGFSGAYFRDAQTGWMAYGEGTQTQIYRTDDGARSWRSIATLPEMHLGMLRPGGRVIAGGDGRVLHSADGAVWDTMRFPVPERSLEFVSLGTNGTGWAAVQGGRLLVTRDTARTWQVQAGGRALLATAFSSASRGWAVGRGGMLLRTQNGGSSWEPHQPGTTADLHSVAVRTPRDTWAVGDQGTVIRSRIGTYGPRAWSVQRLGIPASEALRRVQFADSLTGWISGDSTLLRTVDGGRTWQRLALPGGLLEIQFTSDRNGWGANDYAVFRTTDGGSTWQGVPETAMRELTALPGLTRLWFLNDSIGWKLQMSELYATRDGGRTWTPQPLDGARGIQQMRFVDERTGYAVGESGSVFRTTNGGVSWQRDSVPTTRDLFDIAVVGERAWAVGAGGAIFRRGESGEWQGLRTTTAPANWFFMVCMLLAGSVVVAVRRSGARERAEAARSAESVEALLISDRPLQPGDPDPFDLNRVALGVSKFLRNPRTRPPLTIAVTGRWGTGKSSLMNLIRRDLEANRFRPVWFNAWHHQKEEHLLAALLESIRAQAVPRWLSFSGLLFRARLFWIRVKRHRPSAWLVGLATVLFLGYLAGDTDRAARLWTGGSRTALDPVGTVRGWVDGVAADFSAGGGSLAVYLTLATAGLAAAVWRTFRAFGVKPATLMATLAGRARLRDLQQQTGFRYQFAQEFSEVTEALHPMDMVLFVDDLDRCRPEQVLEVLESINFLVSSGDCVVVMGMDRDWVISCVGLAFDEIAQESINLAPAPAGAGAATAEPELQKRTRRGDFARHYLEKLVNIEIPVPVPTSDQLRGLVRSSAPERRTSPRPSSALLPTAGLRFLRDPRTAAYVALGAVVFSISMLAFRPRAAAENLEAGFQALSSAANTAAPATDSAAAPAGSVPAPANQSPAALLEQEAPGELIGVPPVERTLAGPIVGMIVLVLAMGVALLQRRDSLARDSRTFTTALGAWSGVIASRGFTPRITKKFLNRLRYYAMRQRALEQPETAAQRLSRALRRFWNAFWASEPPSAPVAAEEAPPVISLEERRAAREDPIPEPVLVALACLHECYPDGTPRQAYEDFHRFVRENELTAPFGEEILSSDLAYPRSLAQYRAHFDEISAGVRIH